MRKVLFTILLIMAMFACPLSAQRYRQHQVSIIDEYGKAVTDITSITIFNSGLGTSPTIYSDRAGDLTMTNPITTSSTNSTFVQSLGQVRWFQRAPTYKITITDGTRSLTLDARAEGDTNFAWFANYIGSLSSFNLSDTDDLNFGTDTDVVGTWENANNILSWIPAVDGVAFDIGDSGTTANMDFNVYVGAALGLKVNEGTPSFTWDGGAASINTNSNFATNINTGTSTGAVNIGSSTSGIITIDSTTTLTMNSDEAMALTTSDASADLSLDATAGSVVIDGGEAVDDAVVIKSTGAAGGIDITSLGDIDITTTGAAGEDINITNTGGTIIVTATEAIQNVIHIEENGGAAGSINLYANQGTGVSATTEHDASVQLHSDDGGISLYTTANLANAIRIETNGGTSETIVINNVQSTAAGAITIAANAAGGDVNIDSVLGRIEIEAEEDALDAVLIIADGGTTTTMRLFNDTGTGVSAATETDASVQLMSDVGGIGLYSALNAANAIRLETNAGTSEQIILHSNQGTSVTEGTASIQLLSDAGGIILESNANLAKSIQLIADAGTTETIYIQADQGTGVASIELVSDAGGLTLTGAKPVVITNAFEPDIVLVADSSPYTVLATDSGQIHIIPDLGQDTTFNMPAEADGMHYKFIYNGGAADVSDWIIDTGANANYFIGGLVHHDTDAGGDDTANYFSDGNSNSKINVFTPSAGTVVEMWCDGTLWRVYGTVISATDAGASFADQ